MSYPQHGNEYHSNPGFSPIVQYVELSSPAPTNATPGIQDPVDWDAFYDVNQSDTSLVMVDGIGLTYAGGVFTATGPGVWMLDLGVSLVNNPGQIGFLNLSVPNYGYGQQHLTLASGNNAERPDGGTWHRSRVVVMNIGDTFGLYQSCSAAASITLITYAAMDIIRIAGSVS